MSERLYSDVIPLLANEDPKVRKYALDTLIRSAAGMDGDSLERILRDACSDPDEDVANTALHGLSLFSHRATPQEARAVRAPVSGNAFDFDPAELRMAAYDALRDCVHALQGLAQSEDVDVAGAAVRVLGRFAFPDSLEVLYKATHRDELAMAAVEAISRYDEDEVLFLMKKFLKRFPQEDVQGRILELIGGFASEDVLPLLASYAPSPSPRLRAKAARGLARCQDASAEAHLLTLLDDPVEEVRNSALDSLGVRGASVAIDPISQLVLGSDDPRCRSRAIMALSRIRSPRCIPVLVQALRDSDPRTLANAVEALWAFTIPQDDVVSQLEPLLDHSNNRIRANAIIAVHPYNKAKARSELHTMIKGESLKDRASAAFVVGELQDVEAVRWLITMINTEQDADVLNACLHAIERLNRVELANVVAPLVNHPNGRIRIQAVRVFAKVAGKAGIKTLEDRFRRESLDTVKSSIVMALGSLCDVGNYMAITRHLQATNERTVANAIEALDKVGALEASSFIQPFLTHGNGRIRANATLAFWKLGDLKVARTLADMLSDGDASVVKAALRSLRQVADYLGPHLLVERPLLVSALKDRYRLHKKSIREDTGFAEIGAFFREIFEQEKQVEDRSTDEERDLVAIVAARLEGGGQIEARELDFVRRHGESTAARYLDLLRQSSSEAPDGTAFDGEEYGEAFRKGRLVPGLFELVSRAKKSKRSRESLNAYVRLYALYLSLLGEVAEAAARLLREDDEAGGLRCIKFLTDKAKMYPDIHLQLGELFFKVHSYEEAFSHYLRAALRSPERSDLVLRLASLAARVEKFDMARRLVDAISKGPDVDEDVKLRASRLAEILNDDE